MIDPLNPLNTPNAPLPPAGGGVPEESAGFILQRGGEELALEKVCDRFTVLPTGTPSPDNWTARVPVQFRGIAGRTKLEEYSVEPAHLEQAMQAARESQAIASVSHVYQLKNSPQTLIYLTDEITVQFSEPVDETTRKAIAASVGCRELQPVGGISNAFIYQVTKLATENPIKIANRLAGRKEVLTAEPNIVTLAAPHYRPKDTLYPKQWYLHSSDGPEIAAGAHIDIEKAWDITRGVRSVVIAVADDSVDLNHPDFQGSGKIVAPKDFKEKDFLPLPGAEEDNHGTACAGVAVAEETGTGIVGVAPGCALMPIRTTGFLDDSAIEDLFNWATDRGASVISCSWGPSAVYFPLSLRQKAALHRAATQGRNGKGCVIVFAAGNANRPTTGTTDEQGWPKDALHGPTKWLGGFSVHPDAITVSACTSLNKKAAYSNWGPTVSVCAPSNNAPPGIWLQETGYVSTPPEIRTALAGEGIFTTDRLGAAGYDPGDYTGYFGGTSSATPVVAGVAALILSANPDLTALEVKQILQNTADKIIDPAPDPQLGNSLGTYDENGHSQWFGYGKVNAFKAVQTAQKQLAAFHISRQIQGQNNQSVAIPDFPAEGCRSDIRIGEFGTVRDIRVSLDIEHSFMGDLEVYLISPAGTKVLLQNRTLGSFTTLHISYSLQSSPVLGLLLNQPARGLWQLLVADCAFGDTGTLKSWKLTLGV
ncbi:S8 family serine peptidase [Kamptonema formosum]|uniref:S8 family serine peptidase n=1 Tax=Kamptonema formosum TaxID=331992 RepID=UPI00034DC229|nr:S8 family serine peptidase [Oscillatoria sp. PCC 10802]